MESYQKLRNLFAANYRLTHLLALAGWDAQTVMPPKGATARGAAMGELQQLLHMRVVSPETRALLEEAEAVEAELDEVARANLHEMRRTFNSESALPDDYTVRRVALIAESRLIWAKARGTNDFASFLPCFKKCVEMGREEARYRSAATGKGAYESLLNSFEPCMTLAEVDTIFDDIKSWLPQLLVAVQEKQKATADSIIPVQYPISQAKQEGLTRRMMEVFGYDFEMGRLDVAAHPFTGMVKEDSRITTHYDENNYQKALLATIHETGHSKYETHMGPKAERGQPVCEMRSLVIHESQSRFQEVVVGRSAAFADFVTPYLNEYYGEQPAFTAKNVRKIHQTVCPDYIRVTSDEVCYPLHILLRYEIERALVEGTMEAEDVPRVWNEKMQEYLGLSTEGRDDIGCLQDVHWSFANFGYFPTYSLGSFFAAQLMATIKGELGEDVVDKCIRTGKMQPIFDKQDEKIWSKGCLYETGELIEKATGEPLTTKYFREYLEKRYLHDKD